MLHIVSFFVLVRISKIKEMEVSCHFPIMHRCNYVPDTEILMLLPETINPSIGIFCLHYWICFYLSLKEPLGNCRVELALSQSVYASSVLINLLVKGCLIRFNVVHCFLKGILTLNVHQACTRASHFTRFLFVLLRL